MIISSSGTYTLTADLAEGIVINADNVRLNLNGHTVRGSDGSGIGIYAPKANNVTVYNGKVTGFETGILLNSTDPVKHTVSGVRCLRLFLHGHWCRKRFGQGSRL